MPKISKSSLLATVCLLGLGTVATAADLPPPVEEPTYGSWYIRGDLGAALSDVDNQPSSEWAFTAGAGIGYRFNEMLRVDLTFDGASNYDFGGAFGNNVDAYSLMGNLYYDIPVDFVVQPYIGGGFGWGDVDGGAFNNDEGIAAAGMAGFGFDLTSNAVIDVGYKFRYIDVNAGVADYWIDHMFRTGIRLSF